MEDHPLYLDLLSSATGLEEGLLLAAFMLAP